MKVEIFVVFFMCQVILDRVLDILTITLTLGLVKFYGERLCFRRHPAWLVLSCMFCLLLWPVVPASAQLLQSFVPFGSVVHVRHLVVCLGLGCWFVWLSNQSLQYVH